MKCPQQAARARAAAPLSAPASRWCRWGLAAMSAALVGGGARAEATVRWCDELPRPAYAFLERVRVSDDWFQVYRVSKDVYAIYEPYQAQEVISYLILGSSGAILLDTGMGIGRIRTVVRDLTRLPVRVVNSHTHFDHVGGNADFADVLGMDMAYTRTSAEGMGHDRVRDEVAPEALCRPLPDGVLAESYTIRPFRITGLLKDGDVLDLGGRRLEVLGVPGHTPDSLALLDRDAGLLWTGDTFYEGPIWLFVPETDLDAYRASVLRLAALAPSLRLLLPAHNTPTAAPGRLQELSRAVDAIRTGSAQGHVEPGDRIEYDFDGFSLLLSARSARPSGKDSP